MIYKIDLFYSGYKFNETIIFGLGILDLKEKKFIKIEEVKPGEYRDFKINNIKQKEEDEYSIEIDTEYDIEYIPSNFIFYNRQNLFYHPYLEYTLLINPETKKFLVLNNNYLDYINIVDFDNKKLYLIFYQRNTVFKIKDEYYLIYDFPNLNSNNPTVFNIDNDDTEDLELFILEDVIIKNNKLYFKITPKVIETEIKEINKEAIVYEG